MIEELNNINFIESRWNDIKIGITHIVEQSNTNSNNTKFTHLNDNNIFSQQEFLKLYK